MSVCELQAEKLVFIASQAAVNRRGSELDAYEQDVAALCEAQAEEDNAQPVDLSGQDYDEQQYDDQNYDDQYFETHDDNRTDNFDEY